MKKTTLLLFLSLPMVSFQTIAVESPPPFVEIPIVPEQPTTSAVTVSIGSNGAGLDRAALHAVRRITGSAVARGTVDTFVVTSPRQNGPFPIEGGLVFCAESGFDVFNFEFNEFVGELQTIQPAEGTFVNINLVDRCSVVQQDDPIVCTEDAKICPDGSGVGRVPPSCDFALCPGDEVPVENGVIADDMNVLDQDVENQDTPPVGDWIPVEPDNGIGDGAGPLPGGPENDGD